MARPQALRGEVWLADLGYAGKRRPCLVLSVPYSDQDRALVAYVPATTSLYGSQFEVSIDAKFLRQNGVFNVQGLAALPQAKLVRKLGELNQEQLAAVEEAVKRWLGFVPQ